MVKNRSYGVRKGICDQGLDIPFDIVVFMLFVLFCHRAPITSFSLESLAVSFKLWNIMFIYLDNLARPSRKRTGVICRVTIASKHLNPIVLVAPCLTVTSLWKEILLLFFFMFFFDLFEICKSSPSVATIIGSVIVLFIRICTLFAGRWTLQYTDKCFEHDYCSNLLFCVIPSICETGWNILIEI